jgi:hypothetical protein
MKDNTIVTGLGAIIGLGVFGCIVAVGILSASFWVSLLAFVGLILTVVGVSVANEKHFGGASVALLVAAGVTGIAMLVGDMAGRWLWFPLWFLVILGFIQTGLGAVLDKKNGAAFFALFLCFLVIIIAILSPLMYYDVLRGEAEQATLQIWQLALAVGMGIIVLAWAQGIMLNAGWFTVLALLGVGLLGTASFMANFSGGWWWVAPWLLTSSLMFHTTTGWFRSDKAPKIIGYVLSIMCLLLAIMGPLWLFKLGGPGPEIEMAATAPQTEQLDLSQADQAATQLAQAQFAATFALETQAAETQQAAVDVKATREAATQQVKTQRAKTEQAAAQAATVKAATQAVETARAAEQKQATQAVQTEQAMQTAAATLSDSDLAATELANAIAVATAVVQTEQASASVAVVTDEPAVPEKFPSLDRPSDEAVRGPKTVWVFIKSVFSSVWGVIYLLMVVAIGQLWFRKGGGAIAVVLLFASVWGFGSGNTNVFNTFLDVFSKKPALLMQDMLLASIQKFGNMGWGIILSTVLLMILLTPGYSISLKVNRDIKKEGKSGQALSESFLNRIMSRENMKSGQLVLATFVIMILSVGYPIALWLGLRGLVKMDLTIPLAFLGIPNLSIPNWRPVWKLPYFILGGIIAVANIIFNNMQNAYNMKPAEFSPVLSTAGSIFGAFILTLFAPAGVMIMILVEYIAQFIRIPIVMGILSSKEKKEAKRRREAYLQRMRERPKYPVNKTPARPVSPPKSKPKPKPKPYFREHGENWVPPEEKKPVSPPKDTLPGNMVYKALSKVVDLAVVTSDSVVYIDEEGTLRYASSMIMKGSLRGRLAEPAGLVKLSSENEYLAVSHTGALLHVNQSGREFSVLNELEAGLKIEFFAMNPFGTMIAFGEHRDSVIHGLFLTSQAQQPLAEGILSPTTIAISQDGRHLAVGTQSGKLYLVSISTRKVSHELTPRDFDADKVERVEAMPDGSWLAVYANNYLATWSPEGDMLHKYKVFGKITCTAVDPATGDIAYGSSMGYVRIRSQDLSKELFKDKLQSSKVIELKFFESDILFSVGNDRSIRTISTNRDRPWSTQLL